jgi:hypothetical protein
VCFERLLQPESGIEVDCSRFRLADNGLEHPEKTGRGTVDGHQQVAGTQHLAVVGKQHWQYGLGDVAGTDEPGHLREVA